MEYLIITIVVMLTSLLTFFSGFGLGTILTPVFIIFFPPEIAIALTGIVHFLNSVFKMGLIGTKANIEIVLRFGIPAMIGSFIGACLLLSFSVIPEWYSYQIGNKTCFITPLKITIALLMMFFALFEIIPSLKRLQFNQNKLYIGGAISGFFGGLSGHQGALRSAFLLKCGLTKESFIATGVFIALVVDITRIAVYFNRFYISGIQDNIKLLILAVLSAFLGAYFGRKLLNKTTLHFVQIAVSVMILLLSIALGAGII